MQNRLSPYPEAPGRPLCGPRADAAGSGPSYQGAREQPVSWGVVLIARCRCVPQIATKRWTFATLLRQRAKMGRANQFPDPNRLGRLVDVLLAAGAA